MVIDLRKIGLNGKDEESFCFEYVPDRNLLTIPNAEIKPPVTVLGKATLSGKHSAYVEGEITYIVSGECTKCLNATEKKYVVAFSEHVDENPDGDYKVVNDKIDLTAIVDNEILINDPISFLCKDDCRGICPGCGVNLNYDDCKCEK